jgi:hypothetical protein
MVKVACRQLCFRWKLPWRARWLGGAASFRWEVALAGGGGFAAAPFRWELALAGGVPDGTKIEAAVLSGRGACRKADGFR